MPGHTKGEEESEPLTLEMRNAAESSSSSSSSRARGGSIEGGAGVGSNNNAVGAAVHSRSRRASPTPSLRTLTDPGYAAVVSCFTYTFCSITMVLANKALASQYEARIDFLVIAFQSLCAVILVLLCDGIGIIQLGTKFDKSIALRWFPVNICFVSMLSTGFLSLIYLNVPMVTVFKNLTNVGIMFGEWYFYDQHVSSGAIWSCVVMIVGAVLAAANDITFSPVGYFWMVMNCLCTAGYVLYMKHATKTIRITKFGMVFYNNLLSMPILLAGALYKGEFNVLQESDELHTVPYLTLNIYAGLVGFFLNLATLWCVSNNTATTYAVVGALNKVPLAVIGWMLFKTPITNKTLIFLSLSMCGGFLYTYAKIKESQERGLPR